MGLVARVIEEAGIPTVLVSTGRDLTELVRPPRSLFVNAPMGNPFGPAGDTAEQRRILDRALELFHGIDEAGTIVDDSLVWDGDFTETVNRTLGAMSAP